MTPFEEYQVEYNKITILRMLGMSSVNFHELTSQILQILEVKRLQCEHEFNGNNFSLSRFCNKCKISEDRCKDELDCPR